MKKNHQSKPDKNRIRLNRYLAMAGIGSRRKCDDYIVKGRVKVNEQLTTRLGTRIDPEKDVVYFDGKRVELQKEFIYILLNKPLRTVSTAQDEKNRRTVLDILGTSKRLFPVGRLDYNSTGALLITNDGKLTYYLIHPRFRVKKIYRVLINKIMRPIDLHHFQHGIWLDGRKTHPCRVRELRRIDNRSYFEIELQEGRNRQIRRMFEVLGYHVEQLHRKRFANLSVDDLKPGEWRELSDAEVEELKKLVNEQRDQIQEAEY